MFIIAYLRTVAHIIARTQTAARVVITAVKRNMNQTKRLAPTFEDYLRRGDAQQPVAMLTEDLSPGAVSYTHLTLPTIYSV